MDIGIDLGTTFSVIAVTGKVELAAEYPEAKYLEDCDVTIIPSPYGQDTFPSAVIEDPDEPGRYIAGIEAVQKIDEGLAPAMFTKRKMGTRETIPMSNGLVLAKDVAAVFLKHLKDCAETALGQPVQRAVITHPAYFDRGAVEETREAAIEAGFDMSLPEQMLMEPVAAALTCMQTDSRDPLRVLTYDLGGGTFDVTYLERSGGVIEMRAFDGNHLLGGYNFDRELAHWIRQCIEARGRAVVLEDGTPDGRARLTRLLQLAEKTKIDLAEARTDTTPIEIRGRDILVDTAGRSIQFDERITREKFVGLIDNYLIETIDCCNNALRKAKVEPSELDEILLVGGSTYGPWVQNAVAAAFPGITPRLFHPDLCVGAGAALHAKACLPQQVTQDAYSLTLDVPDLTPLDEVNVGGCVTAAIGRPVEHLWVELLLPTGGAIGPVPVAEADGSFLFTEVELRENAPNSFNLKITNHNGVSVMAHPFAITCAPESAEASRVTSVLPRPLYIETQDGLVALAEEGVALPTKVERTFQRINDNPAISMMLYQEQDPIGEIRIENIPPEGGRGAFVDLTIEVTAKNQIRGAAAVRIQSGRIVAHSPIRVRLDIPDIPSAVELRNKLDALRMQWIDVALGETELEQQVEEKGRALLERADHLFQLQPVERAEVNTTLRELERLLNPPPDDMHPTRRQFCSTLSRVRAALTETEQKSRELLQQESAREPASDEQPQLTNADRMLRRAQHLRQVIDRYEQDGLAAHEKRDRRTWARIYDGLTDVEAKVRERPKIESPPTILTKLFACLSISEDRNALEDKRDTLAAGGRLADWQSEIARIEAILTSAVAQIEEIDSELPSDQARARVQLIMQRMVAPARKSIEDIGAVIRNL